MEEAALQPSARLLALLSLLQLRRDWTGEELAGRLEVGPRTIRRDIDKLRALGYPVHAARGVAGGYRLGSGGRLPPLLLDDAEAVAVAVGLRSAAAGSVAGVEETSVRALAKLEQVLPDRLRRQVHALGAATSAVAVGAPVIDADVLTALAGTCRDTLRARFSYVAGDGRASQRHTEPCALVHSGFDWYLVAFDLDRNDWRTFRVDRIRGRVRPGGRGKRRTVPGGDPAAYVQSRAGRSGELGAAPARIRLHVPAARIEGRIPSQYATADPDGEDSCVVTTRGPWSLSFLIWMALLDQPMEVLGPPEFAAAARALAGRLSAAIPETPAGPWPGRCGVGSDGLVVRRGCGEVVAVVEVGDEAGVGRFPSEDFACHEVGHRVVEGDHHREEPEVRLQPVVRDARGRYAQVVADALRDVAQRDAFVPDRMPPGACRRVLERQLVEVTDVECVPGGPPVP